MTTTEKSRVQRQNLPVELPVPEPKRIGSHSIAVSVGLSAEAKVERESS